MEAIIERVMYKGSRKLPFIPGVFYDAKFFFRDGEIVVCVPRSENDWENIREASYKTISDMLGDWAFTLPDDTPDMELSVPVLQDFTHYKWTAYAQRFIKSYASTMKVVGRAINQCDPLTCGNELAYLHKTMNALRSIKANLASIIVKPMK